MTCNSGLDEPLGATYHLPPTIRRPDDAYRRTSHTTHDDDDDDDDGDD
jgi:hypothetical protein